MRLRSVYLNQQTTEEAMGFLYDLLKQRDVAMSVSHTTLPDWRKHVDFVMSRPYRLWFLIEADGPVGHIYATDRNEIGIFIGAEHHRRGYAAAAILELIARYKPLPPIPSKRVGRWLANINPANEASKALFRSLGFSHIQETFAL